MKVKMNENGKHKLRRSDRIRKNVQIKILEDDPYHYHKKQCGVIDVLERKIELLEERVKVLENVPLEINEPVYEFPWDIFFFLLGVMLLFCYYDPKHITVSYTYQPAITSGGIERL
jgi:hypothetical protein